jgi:hypothetical protein
MPAVIAFLCSQLRFIYVPTAVRTQNLYLGCAIIANGLSVNNHAVYEPEAINLITVLEPEVVTVGLPVVVPV